MNLAEALEERGALYPQIGKNELSVLREEEILVLTLHKDVRIGPEGTYNWQEVTLLTTEKIVIWMINEISGDESSQVTREVSAEIESIIRVVPFSSINEVSMRSAYDKEGEVVAVNVLVMLENLENLQVAPDDTGNIQAYNDVLQFGRIRSKDGNELDEVIELGQTLSRLLGRGGTPERG